MMVQARDSHDRGTSPPAPKLPEMVDIAFGLSGQSLPPEFEWPLFHAISRIIPWMLNVPHAGILPLRGHRMADGTLMLTHRSRVVVRLPRERLCSASAVEGKSIEIGGAALTLGKGTYREHLSAATLYSPRVTTGEADEVRFLTVIESELEALGVSGHLICGRRLEVELEEGRVPAFPVAVHGLREADSLLLQCAGLGRGNPVGCGLLYPHKTIVAAD